jgi:hypothetical protein
MNASRSLVVGALAALALVIVSAQPAGAMMTPAQKQLKRDQMALVHDTHMIAVDEEKFPQRDAREAARIDRHAASAANDEVKAAATEEKIAELEEASKPNLERIEHLLKLRVGLEKKVVQLGQLIAAEEVERAQNEAVRQASLAKLHAAQHKLEAGIALDEKEIEEGL